jgi:hypothetical protein
MRQETEMGHRIIDAIIEDGQLKYVGEKLPSGRVKVHLIYDIARDRVSKRKALEMIRRTAGIYRGIDAAAEARRLRRSWDREPWK